VTEKSLRLVFMGTPAMAAPSLEAVVVAGHRVELVITQPDRAQGRGRKLARGAVAAAAEALGLRVAQPATMAELISLTAQARPELVVALAYGRLLPPAVLQIPPLGALNVHFSLLPALRGAAPIQRAVLAGLAQSGASVMFIDEGLDTGDIVLQEPTPIAPQDTAGSLAERLARRGAALLVRAMAQIAAGQAKRRPQDHALASHAPRLTKDEGLIDWARPARQLDCHVRGMDPWPGAFCPTPAGPLRLFGPTLVWPDNQAAPPGLILAPPAAAPNMLTIACGQGALSVGHVQAPGKRRLPAAEFLRGARLAPGQFLCGP